jgi:hypothetical protein
MMISRCEKQQTVRLLRRLDEAVANFRQITAINRNVGFFTTGYNWLIQIIPAVIVAPAFIRGDIAFGVITQSAAAFALLVGAFSLIVTQFQSISTFAAVVTRLSFLLEAIEQSRAPTGPSGIEIVDQLVDQTGGLDTERDWNASLSLREQQLLASSEFCSRHRASSCSIGSKRRWARKNSASSSRCFPKARLLAFTTVQPTSHTIFMTRPWSAGKMVNGHGRRSRLDLWSPRQPHFAWATASMLRCYGSRALYDHVSYAAKPMESCMVGGTFRIDQLHPRNAVSVTLIRSRL